MPIYHTQSFLYVTDAKLRQEFHDNSRVYHLNCETDAPGEYLHIAFHAHGPIPLLDQLLSLQEPTPTQTSLDDPQPHPNS